MSSSLSGIPPLSGMRGGGGGGGSGIGQCGSTSHTRTEQPGMRARVESVGSTTSLCSAFCLSAAPGRGLGGLAPLGRPSSGSGSSIAPLDSLGSGGGSGAGGLGALNLQGKDFSKAKLGSAVFASGSNTSPALGTRSLSGSSSSTHSPSSSSAAGGAAGSISGSHRIRPLRFGVRFSPPTLALEYRDLKYPTRGDDGGRGGRDGQQYRSRLKCFDLSTLYGAEIQQGGAAAVDSIARQLARQFEPYLGAQNVSHNQLARVVKKALSKQPSQQQPLQSRTQITTAGSRQQQPLHRATFSPADDSLDLSTADADAADESGDLDGLYHPAPRASDDLNAVSASVLAAKKAEMNKLFEKHALKPGEPGYVYDKQVEFEEPTEESEWD